MRTKKMVKGHMGMTYMAKTSLMSDLIAHNFFMWGHGGGGADLFFLVANDRT